MAAKQPKTKYCRYEDDYFPIEQFRETARNGWVHRRPGGQIPMHTIAGDLVGSGGGGSVLPARPASGIAARFGSGLPSADHYHMQRPARGLRKLRRALEKPSLRKKRKK